MIINFYGAVGSGKTLSAIKYVDDNVKKGDRIIANFNIDVKKFGNTIRFQMLQIQKTFVSDVFASVSKEHHTFVILDEMNIWYNSNLFMFRDEFEAYCRKWNVTLIYLSQQDLNTLKSNPLNQLRIGYGVWCHKMGFGFFRQRWFPQNRRSESPEFVRWFRGKKYYSYYNTLELPPLPKELIQGGTNLFPSLPELIENNDLIK